MLLFHNTSDACCISCHQCLIEPIVLLFKSHTYGNGLWSQQSLVQFMAQLDPNAISGNGIHSHLYLAQTIVLLVLGNALNNVIKYSQALIQPMVWLAQKIRMPLSHVVPRAPSINHEATA